MDDQAIQKRFQDNDNLGEDSNVLLRPLRQLFTDRKPTGKVTPLRFQLGDEETYPFGALYVGQNRISFWPVYPKGTDMTKMPDHITLELPSGKSHWTGFNADGQKYRLKGQTSSWRLHSFDGSGLSWWFPFFVKWSTLQDQDSEIQRLVEKRSPADEKHVKERFVEYVQGLATFVNVRLPLTQVDPPAYVLCNLYVIHEPESFRFTPEMFIARNDGPAVEGWPENEPFDIQPSKFTLEGCEFLIVTACPPGTMIADVRIGLPKVDTKEQSSEGITNQ